ncbi:unnamed protein product [Mesocestoides corti]|uniref:Uncharacterized protein n=1 Tax=Mesocestoides corti TaxID=53468 RepID=A0A0R3UGR9_MESCO|nr:unnamed protein product [Mesocestoides corti]
MSRGKDTSELKPRDRNLSGHISNRDETNEPDSKAFVRDSKNEKEEATKFRPNCDGDDDVFSSGEEEAMQRTAATRTCQGTSGRRLSSLDIYQLNHKEENVNYVLKGKESLQDVIEEASGKCFLGF